MDKPTCRLCKLAARMNENERCPYHKEHLMAEAADTAMADEDVLGLDGIASLGFDDWTCFKLRLKAAGAIAAKPMPHACPAKVNLMSRFDEADRQQKRNGHQLPLNAVQFDPMKDDDRHPKAMSLTLQLWLFDLADTPHQRAENQKLMEAAKKMFPKKLLEEKRLAFRQRHQELRENWEKWCSSHQRLRREGSVKACGANNCDINCHKLGQIQNAFTNFKLKC